MTFLDRFLQRWRFGKVARHLRPGDRLLDVGCGDGALGRHVAALAAYVGVDPAAPEGAGAGSFVLVRGTMPPMTPPGGPFDAVAMVASLEHVPEEELPALATCINRALRTDGKLIITVPSPFVDEIVRVLAMVRLVDAEEMKPDEHHGFEPRSAVGLFERHGFDLDSFERFQLGLNNCIVFRKARDVGDAGR